ncbi:alkaline phosphatase family protein [Mycobacterium sp. 3519A]|uniref:alkaline phosphatase family protein n=1 Tax=Mycobacterium sp. 3519A TaxID=2057184 RepID=UPI001F19D90B|nr:alkaline phosphatase family protein [Mycobacterium sp. 3519A]
MGYVGYVGRVGALAVALGVGLAVGTMPGVALAEPSDAASTTSVESDSPPPKKHTPKKKSSSTPVKPDEPASTAPDTASAATPSTKVTTTDRNENTPTTPKRKPRKVDPDRVTKKSTRSPAPSNVKPKADSSTDTAPTPSPPNEFRSAADMPSSSARTVTVSTPVTSRVEPPKFSGPLTPLNIVTEVVSSLLGWAGLGPSMTASPFAPLHEPVLWTMLAWVRREIEQTLRIAVPTAGVQHVPALIVTGPNLLVNPGAELGDPSLSGYSSVTVPGWTVTGTPTVIEYGTPRRFPWPTSSPGPTFPRFLAFPTSASAPPDSGEQFFGGGPVATSTLSQTVDLRAAATEIDGGTVPYALSGYLGGFTIDPSAASVRVEFLDASGATLGTGRIRPVGVLDRFFQTRFLSRQTTGTIPVGTRAARVVVTLADRNPVLGNYNNAYADNLSFRVGSENVVAPTLVRPDSHVGELDHVFMVYMENKGFSDIVGSRNAPYLNSLIQTYGFASKYYALTHPSDPNYYPIIGGSDFGFNYNCPADCFDPPVNLVDNIELAHKTWAGYMEGGGGYSTPTDRLPFLAFHDIYDDQARVESHLFDLSEMAGDLVVPHLAPDFVWFAADDATNMEGPTDTLSGVIGWALSQLTPQFLGGHQYNVAAGDRWLAETLPIIMDSNTWNDPNERSAIFLTFDEDYNNISLGIGNDGNHIVTVVIPSPGAVAGGMRAGAFIADDRYDHYSLLRTIEDSLGLPPLTNNDRYAYPMNEFWT